MLRRMVVRLSAILLLFTAASCLLATDPFFPQICQEDSSNPGSPALDADCFCCCGHVVPVAPQAPAIVYMQVATVPDASLIAFSTDPPLIYHPPRV